MSCTICKCLFKSYGEMIPYTLPCGDAICKGCLNRTLKGQSKFKCGGCGEEHDKSEINVNWDVVAAEESIEEEKKKEIRLQNDINIDSTFILGNIPMFNTNRYTQTAPSSHKSHKKYVCYMCYESFENYDDFNEHVKEAGHEKTFDNNKTFRCDVCDSVFKSYKQYRAHLDKEKHSTVQVHKCSYPGCNMKFARKEELIEHINETGHALVQGKLFSGIPEDENAPIITKSGDLLYYATLTPAQMSVEYHDYTCFTLGCGETFDVRVKFDEHVKFVHGGKRFSPNSLFTKYGIIQKTFLTTYPRISEKIYMIISEAKTFDEFCSDFPNATRKVFALFGNILLTLNDRFFQGKLDLVGMKITQFRDCFVLSQDFDLFVFFFETLYAKQIIQNPYVLFVIMSDLCYFLSRVLPTIKKLKSEPKPSKKSQPKEAEQKPKSQLNGKPKQKPKSQQNDKLDKSKPSPKTQNKESQPKEIKPNTKIQPSQKTQNAKSQPSGKQKPSQPQSKISIKRPQKKN